MEYMSTPDAARTTRRSSGRSQEITFELPNRPGSQTPASLSHAALADWAAWKCRIPKSASYVEADVALSSHVPYPNKPTG